MTGRRQKPVDRTQKKGTLSHDALAIGCWLLTMGTAGLGATTNELADSNAIPPLRPPKPEILPGFWEQHGGQLALAAVAVLLAGLFLWKILSRPKPCTPPVPAELARNGLRALLTHQEDSALLAQVSSVLRQYFVAAFELPHQEFTNRELGRQLAGHPKIDPALRTTLTNLLEGMEHRRFGLEVNASERSVVEQALDLIEQAETRRRPPPQVTDSASHGP